METLRKEIALDTLLTLLDETYFEPRQNWWSVEFNKRVYERWAIGEIIIRLQGSFPDADPVYVVDSFKNELIRCISDKKRSKKNEMFYIGIDICNEIVLFFV